MSACMCVSPIMIVSSGIAFNEIGFDFFFPSPRTEIKFSPTPKIDPRKGAGVRGRKLQMHLAAGKARQRRCTG